jgi:hypothetical protein
MTKASNKYKFYNLGPFLIGLSWSDKNLWNLTSDKGENYKMLFAFNYVTSNNEEEKDDLFSNCEHLVIDLFSNEAYII